MTDTEFLDCPTAWFATLERAMETSDFALAAKAQAELKRLGVLVKFAQRKRLPLRTPEKDAPKGVRK